VTVIAALVVSPLIRLWGSKTILVLGLALAVLAFSSWGIVAVESLIQVGVFVVLGGLGLGLISAAIPVIIPEVVPQSEKGISTGLFNSAQTLGGALGGGLFLALLKVGANFSSGADSVTLEVTNVGYSTVWLTSAGLLGLAMIIFIFLFRDKKSF
jgi:Na+/melibiose symporter-like transporter